MNPSVAIIIVTYNSAPHIAACLESLRSLRYEPAPQVVIVDNASTDDSIGLSRQHMPGALLLPQSANLGFAGGVNLGVAASDSAIVALLNPDAVVEPGWLNALVAALADPSCGLAGSKILDQGGNILRHAGGEVVRPALLTRHRGDGEADRGQYDAPSTAEFLTGAAIALRREVWARLGGMDAGFFPAYFEDLDLCQRVWALGLECRYVPHAIVQHVEATTTGKYSGAFYYYYHRGRLRFACKHLPWDELWGVFCPAEAARLNDAPLLDQLVAGLAYRESLPRGLAPPSAAEQAHVLANGRALAAIPAEQHSTPADWPAAAQELLGLQPRIQRQIAALLDEARREAILREHTFQSRLPLVAGLRRRWNNIATRWYVLPALHQQTRVNLAIERSLTQLAAQLAAASAAPPALVYQAALCFQMAMGSDNIHRERASRK